MGFFPRGRHTRPSGVVVTVPRSVPPGFEVVAEALVEGRPTDEACGAVGRELARDGASLEEAMAGLRETWRAVRGQDPCFSATTDLLRSWSETTFAFVHEISCEDPLTGLASLAHLRSCLSSLFRGSGRGEGLPHETHALVVVDLPRVSHSEPPATPVVLSRALRMARVGETVRTVFPGSAVVCQVGSNRLAVLAPRERRLGVRVRLLRRLIDGLELDGDPPRLWIEGIPATDTGAALLIDELARP